jgi:hypothetical protein
MTLEHLQDLVGDAFVFPRSIRTYDGETFAFAKHRMQSYLIIAFDPQLPALHHAKFSGEVQDIDTNTAIKWCYPQRQNAAKLRALFPFTAPQVLGLKKSFGAGDRLGLAAPAHIRAARNCDEAGIALLLAQQSIGEMERTARTPDMVLDAATWGAFQEGYEIPWGADADHLKTEEDVRKMADAGFTFFAIDSSEYVDDKVNEYSAEELDQCVRDLPDGEALAKIYITNNVNLHYSGAEPVEIDLSRIQAQRAIVKYSRAVSHTVKLAQLLNELKGEGNFGLEMSVDKTKSPTSVAEHYFIARELEKRDVRMTSLAIRFVGEFQKGVDYIGDLREFESRLKKHLTIAKAFGPYKISVHSGSDKFSIYPILGKVCGELLHVKTAGTWYLQALRTVARYDAKLSRELCEFAAALFAEERANYHISENLNDLPNYKNCDDDQLEKLFESNALRQMLHLTYGPVLTAKTENGAWRFRARLYELLQKHEDAHHAMVEEYSSKHFKALGWCK